MRQRERKVLALIPLNLDGYLFSGEWKSGKEEQVKSRMAADSTGWEQNDESFRAALERVVEALKSEPRNSHPHFSGRRTGQVRWV